MNTRHAYSPRFLQVDTLVFFPALDHLNDSLISATWEGSRVMWGLGCSMCLVGLSITAWQLEARRRLADWRSGFWGSGEPSSWRLVELGMKGSLAIEGSRGVAWALWNIGREGERHTVSWHPWDSAALPLTLQESQGYCSWSGAFPVKLWHQISGLKGEWCTAATRHQVRQGSLLSDCAHMHEHTAHTNTQPSLKVLLPPTHHPLHGAYSGNAKHKVNMEWHSRHLHTCAHPQAPQQLFVTIWLLFLMRD